MISIRFKDYLQDWKNFDRFFTKTAARPSQAKLFADLAESLLDALREYRALEQQSQKVKGEEGIKLLKEFQSFPEQIIKVKSFNTVSAKSAEKWLVLSIEDYAVLRKHKVLKD